MADRARQHLRSYRLLHRPHNLLAQLNSLVGRVEYGSLSGGSPTVFASITGTQLATIGWTTM